MADYTQDNKAPADTEPSAATGKRGSYKLLIGALTLVVVVMVGWMLMPSEPDVDFTNVDVPDTSVPLDSVETITGDIEQ